MGQRAAYLAALGVPDWRQRRALAVQPLVPPPATPAALLPEPGFPRVAVPALDDTWDAVAAEVEHCTRCKLHACRTRTVFGVGNRRARWLVVGEAPGAEEDRQGEPFVGRAGKLLDAMLLAIGLRREEVFIANVLKCRPPDNRNPAPDEVAQCLPYLERQIALLKPSIMLAVGSVAAQNLLATDVPVGRLRGNVHAFGNARTPLVVTYHPAYLLRSPGEKRKVWEDLKFARRVAGANPA
jgi:DNA polymerase